MSKKRIKIDEENREVVYSIKGERPLRISFNFLMKGPDKYKFSPILSAMSAEVDKYLAKEKESKNGD